MTTFDKYHCSIKYLLFSIIVIHADTISALQKPLGLSGEVNISAGAESNVLRLSDNEFSDNTIKIKPTLRFVELFGKHRFEAKYEGELLRFSQLDNLNYSDHKIELDASLDHTSRFKTQVTYKYEEIVELPGLNDSVTNLVNEYNKLNREVLNLKGTYGRPDAVGQLVFRLDFNERDYLNNEQDFRDFNFTTYTGTFFYRIAPNTRFVIEVSQANLNYDSNQFNPGSEYNNYLLGAEWSPTAKTQGIFKIGQQKQDFDNPLINDISGLAYFADIIWKPNTYSYIQVGISRSTRESSEINEGSFISSEFTATARHEFTPMFSLEFDFSYGEDDLVLSNNVNLQRIESDMKFLHKTTRWFSTYLGVEYFSRESNRSVYEINNNKLTFGIRGYFG